MDDFKKNIQTVATVMICLLFAWAVLGTFIMQLAAMLLLMGLAGWLAVNIYDRGGKANDQAQMTFIKMNEANNAAIVNAIIAIARSNNMVTRKELEISALPALPEPQTEVELQELTQ